MMAGLLLVLPPGGAAQTGATLSGTPDSALLTDTSWPDDVARPGSPEPVAIPRLPGPVTLDGRPDEDAWDAVPALPLTMLWPTAGGRMTERSEIRVAYDGEAIWASGRFYDSRPEEIRANTLYRDRWDGDDAFDLIVDAFNDDRTALKFTVTPRGALLDDEIRNDAEPSPGVQWMNPEWNGFWEARTHITEEGWFVEMRIPFSTLRFDPADDGRVVMGLIAARYISRKSEKQIFPAITQDWQAPDFKPSRARDVMLEGVSRPTLLEIAPYALGGVSRSLADPVPADVETRAESREVGLDVKYGLASNLTLDFTLNTDFAQVESDALQVNLTRFNLFFPEKRDFFQERASVFDFTMSDEARLFHSRRIGLAPGGRPLRILGGARLAGRIDLWDVGVLDLQVDGADGVPDENAGVVRIRRTLGGGASAVGGMITSRIPTRGPTRTAAGADGSFHLGGDDFLTLQWAGSWEEGSGAAFADRSLARILFERRAGTGYSGSVDLARAGPAFDPALGFMERRDYTALKASVRHTWRSGADSPLSWHRGIGTTRLYLRNESRSVESALQRLRWQWAFDGGTFLNVALNFEYEDLMEPLDLAGQALVPAGSYFGPNLFLFGSLNEGRDLTGAGILHVGTFLDGWQASAELRPTWRPSPHFTTRLEYRLSRLWFPGRDESVTADVARLRLNTALDTHLSGQLFVQYEWARQRFATDARLRYRFSEGRDLFLVLTETRTPELRLRDALVPADGQRRFMIKYVHTFRP